MKQLLLVSTLSLFSIGSFAQTQIGNSDMENWESVSQGEEPVNWNSFMTAQGDFSGFADVQIAQSSVVRPGSSGTKSAVIWSRDAGFSVVANGNMTLGKINMGSISPTNSANYNFSDITTADHSEAITDSPDSIAFWVNYVPVSGGEMARVKATLHDDYAYRDPEDANATPHVVATAEMNYGATNGWTRMALPFDYSGQASTVEYILVTFTTNMTPGGGDPGDSVYVDDIELIYNSNSLSEEDLFAVNAQMDYANNALVFTSQNELTGTYEVYNMTGALVLHGDLMHSVPFNEPAGTYIVNVTVGDTSKRFKVFNN